MSATTLLITGGDAFARDVYHSQGRGEWAQAMPLVLEKLGYLGFDVAGPERLSDPRTWHQYAAVLVASVPQGAWTEQALELAWSGRARALVEHPPAAMRSRLGILDAQAAGRDGLVVAVSEPLRTAVAEVTQLSSTYLQSPQSRDVPRDRELDWDRLGVPIEATRAERWRVAGWEVERWTVADDVDVIADWVQTESPRARWPAIIDRGNVRAVCFSLFGYLGQQTTIQPSRGLEYLNWARSTALEALFAELLDLMHREAGLPRARIMPWPGGARWALNIRHDYDRQLDGDQLDRVLAGHRRAGTGVTWYWRSRHVDGGDGQAWARRVRRTPGHEVAHHTEQLWRTAEEEQGAIERAIGHPVSGSSAHGDPTCFRWQGAPNLLWAERQGLEYSEFISHAHVHPHRFSILGAQGTIEHARVICLPHHVSLDRSMEPEDAATDAVLAAAEGYVRAGGLLQILNHPDIHVDELFDVIDRLPSDGRLDATARGIADWWRRSHVRAELEVSSLPDGRSSLTSARGVRGLVVELLLPDGKRPRYVIDLDPQASMTLGAPVASASISTSPDVWRDLATPAFADVVRGYYAAQDAQPSSEEISSTVATNTELVPERVELIRSYLRRRGGPQSLRGLRILDAGAGFGAFATYLALDPDSPEVTAIDVRADFVAITRTIAQRLGLSNLHCRVGDMRSLHELGPAIFDVVVANNSFIYLPTGPEMRGALHELFRALRPGGSIVLFHANRWQAREPFTRAPIVHLFPPALARRVSRITGWRHNHGRVRLVSAPWLVYQMRRCGFVNVRTSLILQRGAAGQVTIARPPAAWFKPFYAVTAQTPARRS